jgi:formate hydrogenlyase subunit 4
MKGQLLSLIPLAVALVFAPLATGVVRKTKAFFAGRKGFPVYQTYLDLFKLMSKSVVRSSSVSWLFRFAPLVSLAASIVACAWLPFGGLPGAFSFPGGFIFLAGLFGGARFVTMLAALDTGSAFEGMGANREVFFSAFAEPAFLLGFGAVVVAPGSLSLQSAIDVAQNTAFSDYGVVASLAAAAFFILSLAENSRIPVDDPTTHLELTMIHEAMILDSSGPDLAFIEYASSLKLWFFWVLIADIVLPFFRIGAAAEIVGTFLFVLALAVATGVVESSMARLRLMKVPQFIGSAAAFAFIAILLKGIL